MPLTHEQFVVWFAGFYEGEGSVSNDVSNNNALRISIAQNDRTPLDMAVNVWGGSVRERVRITPSGKECHGHEWRISKREGVEKFIADIRPFMIIPYKMQQLDICVEVSKTKCERRFKCSFCDMDFANPSGRRRHERQQHVEKGVCFECQSCGNSYQSRDTLTRHQKVCGK